MKRNAVTIILICFALAVFSAARAAAEERCPVFAPLVIYPAPQDACIDDAVKLPATLSYAATTKSFSAKNLSRFSKLFSAAGVKLVKGSPKTAQLVFAESDVKRPGAYRDEGYKINIKPQPFSIKISARSETGFIYAALTIKDLIVPDEGRDMIHTGRVDDYPQFAFRGVLDGGYDIWKYPNRLDILKWLSSVKFNFFIYAPKEDPYFRRQWRVPYPPEMIEQFKNYIKACKEDNVIFSFALSPALSMEYSNPKEFETLVRKYRQIQALGVDNFGIFFDDVLPFLGTPNDRKKFKNIAEAEVYVTNKLLAALREKDKNATLFFVPNQYWGWTPTVYNEVIKKKLNPEIQIGWTGELICSEKIDIPDTKKYEAVIGHTVAIGDNFSPLGPLVARSPDLYKAAPSFVNNPYNFAGDENAQYSKFVNATIGDYTWNPEAYNSERSIIMAANKLAGGTNEGATLLLAVKLAHRTTFESDYRKALRDDVEKIASAPAGEAQTLIAAFKTKLMAHINGFAALKNKLTPPLFAAQMAESFDRATVKMNKTITEIDTLPGDATGAQAAEKIRKALGI